MNPGALAELEEIRGRHEFLDAQRADLERSLDDLRQTIGKLARTSRRRFEETFAAANDRLAEVFPKLFPGGTARLESTERRGGRRRRASRSSSRLPGKKLQSLSLLSGGEKALTATALVFSLFLIRPTPFCLLDEVDAPLDEANIGRFNALVTEMAAALAVRADHAQPAHDGGRRHALRHHDGAGRRLQGGVGAPERSGLIAGTRWSRGSFSRPRRSSRSRH